MGPFVALTSEVLRQHLNGVHVDKQIYEYS